MFCVSQEWRTLALRILESWTGHILLSGPMPHERLTLRVIDSELAYDAFLEELPRQRVQMKQPAPPAEDPLLERPPVDFVHEMMLVAICRAHSAVGKMIGALRCVEGRLVVDLGEPVTAAVGAMRGDVGGYHAVKVARFEGEVVALERRS